MRYVSFVSRVSDLLAAVLLLAVGASLQAQPAASLSLDETLRLAEERSQKLVAQDAAAAAAREMAVAAAQAPDPTLTAGINNLPVNGPDEFSVTRDFMTMRSIGLMRELTRGDKRDARAARFEREADAAQAGSVLALVDLQRDTAMAWLDRYYREQARVVLLRQRDEAALQIEAADLAFRTARGSQSDVFAARSAVAEIEDRLAETDRDVEIATTRLERWIGDAARRPLGQAPAMELVPLHAADLEASLAGHPELAWMATQEQIARADAEIARANKRADWTVEVMYSQRGPDFSNMMSLNFSRPLQWREHSRQDRELAAKLATAGQMRAEREEETRAHVADARELLQGWQSNRARLERYASTLIPLATERTLAATAGYRGGSGTLSSVLEARAAEIATRLDHLMLEMETAELWAALNYLIPAGGHVASHAPAPATGESP